MSTPRDESAYHPGERAVQARAGVRARAEAAGSAMIRSFMPEQHREFFAQLPFVVLGSIDRVGRPWASLLAGSPGFVHAPDPEMLTIEAAPLSGDPLAESWRAGAALGVLGIQLETRRRNRVNGHVREATARGLTLGVDQSFGNCPKYITARAPSPAPGRDPPAPVLESRVLSAQALSCIARADTCFIASASRVEGSDDDPREGSDVSHRGGRPGFVHAVQPADHTVLTMPDFAGNNMFNTLGNLERYPRAGLLFPDFARGDLLLVTGTTEIVWEGPLLSRFAGALRLLRVHVESGLRFAEALPFRWSGPEPAAQLARTGSWAEALDGPEPP